jgi:tetratricopeptide (TPR) repeat protein
LVDENYKPVRLFGQGEFLRRQPNFWEPVSHQNVFVINPAGTGFYRKRFRRLTARVCGAGHHLPPAKAAIQEESHMSKLFLSFFILGLSFAASAQNLDTFDAFQSRGAKSFAKGDFDRAISEFTRAIDASSSVGRSGPVSSSSNSFSEASDIRAVDTRTADAYVQRGRAYAAKGDLDRAIEDFSSAIKVRPSLALAY